jgi:DNA polymerase
LDTTSPRRAVLQTLHDLQRAGVTHLSAPREEASTAAAPSAVHSQRNAGSQHVDTSHMTLEQLARCVADCTRCAELAGGRTQTVFGVGDPDAKILFIGEAPGADEDRLGEPFVGRAGQLLDRIIVACKLKREDVYICNILKCRPPGNRNPTDEEAANCREYLDGQIRLVHPEYIVCWGSVAAKNLLNRPESIGKMRGRFYTHGDAKVLCTYHPSYLLRNPSAKKDVWDDMKFLFRDMGVEL